MRLEKASTQVGSVYKTNSRSVAFQLEKGDIIEFFATKHAMCALFCNKTKKENINFASLNYHESQLFLTQL